MSYPRPARAATVNILDVPSAEIDEGTIHYRTHGDGPPVLGVMGFGLDQRYWAAQVGAVAERNTFITFDHRGSGRSTGPAPGSLAEMATDAVALLDHLEIDKATVYGVSMGGAVAQQLALDHPDRVDALILGITWARPIEYMRRQMQTARVIIENSDPETFIDASLLFMFTPRFFEMGGEAIDRMIASFSGPGAPEIMPPEALLAQLDALEKHDVLEELGRIACPTLVYGGKMDVMVPYFAQEEIAGAIPDARLATFETGHGCNLEEMTEVNARVREFLDSLA